LFGSFSPVLRQWFAADSSRRKEKTMNELVVVGVPLLAIFAGILFQNQRFNGLDARLDRMQADLSQFYQTLGRHEAKIENLEKKANQ
jgi:hypothetical protein